MFPPRARAEIANELRAEVHRLAEKVKVGYVRETALRKHLALVARKTLEKSVSHKSYFHEKSHAGLCDVGAEDVGAEVTTETQSPSKAHLASFLAAATGLARGEDAKGAVVTDGTGTSATQKKSEMSRKKALEEPQRTPKTSLSLAFAAAPPEKRYAAKQRAIDLLCAAAKPDGNDSNDGNDSDLSATRRVIANRSLAATARVMHGINAFVALKRGALPAALALMGSAPKDVAVQIAGCRVISACVANPRVAARARRSPSFAGGGALRAASCALRRFGGSDGNDPSAARAAARAMWTAVHLGGRQAQAEMFLSNGALTVSPLLLAMHAHGDDASVTEACCGCLLASILDGPQSGKD